MSNPPLLSIVMVTWNSLEHLSQCLSALSKQTFTDFEIIIVDNGSIDGTVDSAILHDFKIPLIIERLDSNLGFAVANNIGVRLARGEWVALLNVDAFPQSDWLEQMLQAARENTEYNFFTSRQIQANAPQLLDGAGDEYHVSGLAWRKYYAYETAKYGLQAGEVFGACAAAALYVREDFLKVGGFDEDYFSYFEDVDLSFRLRIAGGRCKHTFLKSHITLQIPVPPAILKRLFTLS